MARHQIEPPIPSQLHTRQTRQFESQLFPCRSYLFPDNDHVRTPASLWLLAISTTGPYSAESVVGSSARPIETQESADSRLPNANPGVVDQIDLEKSTHIYSTITSTSFSPFLS